MYSRSKPFRSVEIRSKPLSVITPSRNCRLLAVRNRCSALTTVWRDSVADRLRAGSYALLAASTRIWARSASVHQARNDETGQCCNDATGPPGSWCCNGCNGAAFDCNLQRSAHRAVAACQRAGCKRRVSASAIVRWQGCLAFADGERSERQNHDERLEREPIPSSASVRADSSSRWEHPKRWQICT